MKAKLVLGGVALLAAVAVSVTVRSRRGGGATRWDMMRRRMEQMPADFPPRVMFDNVRATRENTEEILAILRTMAPAGRGT